MVKTAVKGPTQAAGGTDLNSGQFLTRNAEGAPSYSRHLPHEISGGAIYKRHVTKSRKRKHGYHKRDPSAPDLQRLLNSVIRIVNKKDSNSSGRDLQDVLRFAQNKAPY